MNLPPTANQRLSCGWGTPRRVELTSSIGKELRNKRVNKKRLALRSLWGRIFLEITGEGRESQCPKEHQGNTEIEEVKDSRLRKIGFYDSNNMRTKGIEGRPS